MVYLKVVADEESSQHEMHQCISVSVMPGGGGFFFLNHKVEN